MRTFIYIRIFISYIYKVLHIYFFIHLQSINLDIKGLELEMT